MRRGDAILCAYVRDEREHGWVSYNAPKGQRFAFLLLGVCDKGREGDFDVDGAPNKLGWQFAQGIEARSDATAKTGAAEGESPVGKADAPKPSHPNPNGKIER